MIDINKIVERINPLEADKFLELINGRIEMLRDQNDNEDRDIEVRRIQGAIKELRRLKTWLENRRVEKKNDAQPPSYFQ